MSDEPTLPDAPATSHEETSGDVRFSESMGYSIDRLVPGVSSHNNDFRPFRAVPPALLGKCFTQVVSSSRVSPVEVEFRSAGKLFVLAGTDWEGGRDMVRQLSLTGRREPVPPLETTCNRAFEVFSVTGAAGARVAFPTQVMLVADRLSRLGGAPAPANGCARLLVIAARQGCGAFSMFFQVLGHLRLAESQGLRPVVYVNRRVCYWSESGYNGSRNAWEYFFEPISSLSIEQVYPDAHALEGLDTAALQRRLADRAVVRDDYLGQDVGYGGRMDGRQREIAAGLVQRHVRIRPEVRSLADDFFRRELEGRAVVGVHFRGTDKVMEATPPSFERYQQVLDAHIAASPGVLFFTATDCARFLQQLKHRYGDRVVHTAAHRSANGRPVHFGSTASAAEVLVDVILLSRTSHLVHGVSNVSAATLVFNGSLPHTDLG